MQEKDEIKIDTQLQQLKKTYQKIDTDVPLDWKRLERYEELGRQRSVIINFLKLTACFVLFIALMVFFAGGYLIFHFYEKSKPELKTVAFADVNNSRKMNPSFRPGTGGMSTVSSYINNQNISVRPDFNKMPGFSMPRMPRKIKRQNKK